MIQSQFQFDDRRQAPKVERKPKRMTIEQYFLDEFNALVIVTDDCQKKAVK
jgi:hypothetical protein|tara:strand:- start:1938 stop:2090 length:153 start_codon:yes stop_codon:yes gene_type:complete